MSGKPKSSWGGKRDGAGKPPRPKAPPLDLPDDLADAELARTILRHIAMNGYTESARVAAARDLWDRAEGKPGQKVVAEEEAAAKPADKWSDLDEVRPN